MLLTLLLNIADEIFGRCPDVNGDPVITRIISGTQNIDFYLFGLHLGIPNDEVLAIPQTGHSECMIKLFDCWDKKVVDSDKKTWKCILHALRSLHFHNLANEVEQELLK